MFHIWKKPENIVVDRGRREQVWTKEEERYIYSHYKKLTVDTMAKRLKRTASSVDGKLRREMRLGRIEQYPLKRDRRRRDNR